MRQVPETDKGVIFVTLEDEIGSVNLIVWRHIRERQRLALLRSRLLAVARRQRAKDGGTYLIARRLVDVRRGWQPGRQQFAGLSLRASAGGRSRGRGPC